MRRFAILTSLLVPAFLGAPMATAQSSNDESTLKPNRAYQLLRGDEDWSFLADPAERQDFWDPIKYVPFRRDAQNWFLTIGGQAREILEQIGNANWGQRPYMDGYRNERYMLYFDVHYGKHVRTFVELKSGLNSYRIGGPRPIAEKKLDFH